MIAAHAPRLFVDAPVPEPSKQELQLMGEFHFSLTEAQLAAEMIQRGEVEWK